MLRFLLSLLCLLTPGFARPRQVVSKTVPDQFRALSLDKQKLTGLLGTRVRANSEGFLENISLASLTDPISAETTGGASANREFAGLFLDAAADAFEYNHDLQLRTQMDKVAGALASYSQAASSSPGSATTAESLQNTRADLLGLLAYYRVTSEPSALATAQAISASLLKSMPTALARTAPASDLPSLAPLGLLEPLVQLYRLSADKRYLDFCTALVKQQGIPAITDLTPQANLLSTLSSLIGLADLYEVTGDSAYLSPATAAWKMLVRSRTSITGALLPPGSTTGSDVGTSAAWLEFNFKLLRITGAASYGDQSERTVYNQLLAGQDGRNGELSPEVPLNGVKIYHSTLNAADGGLLLREAKALALLPQLVWGRYDSGIDINLYTPGRAFFTLRKHGLVRIYSEGNFPQSGQLQLHVEPSAKTAQFPLRLRVPGWSNDFKVEVADLHLKGQAGDVVVIDRPWKSGDTVRVSMGLPLRSHHGYLQARDEDTGDVVLQRGPQILALAKTLNPDLPNLAAVTVRPLTPGQSISIYEDKLPQSFFGEQVYRISGGLPGKTQELLLVPFADANDYRTALRMKPD